MKKLSSWGVVVVLFLFVFVSVSFAQKKKEDDEFERQRKRSGNVKALQLKIKKKKKLVIKIRKKVTQRAKEDAALLKNSKKVPVNVNQLSASKYADQEQAKIRLNKIKGYNDFLKLAAGNEMLKTKVAEVRFQLAEEFWEHAKYLRFQAMTAHNVEMDKWDKDCRKQTDPSKCPKAPQPNLNESNTYRESAVSNYRKIISDDADYSRRDEVMFYLASNLMETNKYKASIKQYNELLTKHPTSRYVPDTYVALGNHYFRKNKVLEAERNFLKAMEVSKSIFENPAMDQQRKIDMRGIHIRSSYMLSWCRFNTGDFEKSIQGFKDVILLSNRYMKTKESQIVLRDESLRDLILTFSKINQKDVHLVAFEYFKKAMGSKFAYNSLKKLAKRLYAQGSNESSMAAYRYLMTLNRNGESDPFGQDAPLFQNEIVRASSRALWEPDKVYSEVKPLVAYLEEENKWNKRWSGNKKVYEDIRETIEQTLLEYSTTYHQDAQKEPKAKKKELLYTYATKLYEEYIRFFPEKESAYELRFFMAELKYREANRLKGKSGLSKEAQHLFANAAYHYDKVVVQKPKGQYLKQAAFSEVLCYESLANRSGNVSLQAAGKRLKGLSKDKYGRVIWTKDSIKKWDSKLLGSYERYLKIVTDKEERLQAYFKIGVIYYSFKHYLKSMSIFSAMAKEFPTHPLSRRAAFMILYSYEDLGQWPELESNARLFIEDKALTKNPAFKKEMYEMVMRSAYLRRLNERKFDKLTDLEFSARLLEYEKEFGVEGSWKKRNFAISPKAVTALSLAGFYAISAKKILEAISARERLIRLYPESQFARQLHFDLGSHYEQIAKYEIAVGWYEKYVFGKKDYMKLAQAQEEPKTSKKSKRRRVRKTRRSRSKKSSKKISAKEAQKLAKVTQEQENTALFKAARYRRGLDDFERAIALYNEFIKRYPEDKDTPQMYLNIATIHEENKKWEKTIAAFSRYIEKYQPESVNKYLDFAVVKFKKDLIKDGVRKTLDAILKSGKAQSVKTSDLKKDILVAVHARIARAYYELKKEDERMKNYMYVNALGHLMANRKIKALQEDSLARRALAEAKFYLAETRRDHYAGLEFPVTANQRKLKKSLQSIVAYGKTVTTDYDDVAPLKIAKWNLAAFFRRSELTHLFVKKLYKNAENPPKSLPKSLHLQYRIAMENFASIFEENAIDAYVKTLQVSASMGIYNDWIRKCEAALNALRKKKQMNAMTILSQRKTDYWTIDPLLNDVVIRKKAKKKDVIKRFKYLPGSIQKTNLMK